MTYYVTDGHSKLNSYSNKRDAFAYLKAIQTYSADNLGCFVAYRDANNNMVRVTK